MLVLFLRSLVFCLTLAVAMKYRRDLPLFVAFMFVATLWLVAVVRAAAL